MNRRKPPHSRVYNWIMNLISDSELSARSFLHTVRHQHWHEHLEWKAHAFITPEIGHVPSEKLKKGRFARELWPTTMQVFTVLTSDFAQTLYLLYLASLYSIARILVFFPACVDFLKVNRIHPKLNYALKIPTGGLTKLVCWTKGNLFKQKQRISEERTAKSLYDWTIQHPGEIDLCQLIFRLWSKTRL